MSRGTVPRMADETTDPQPETPAPQRRRPVKKILGYGALGLLAVFLLIQLVPYGRDHTNPPATDPVTFQTASQKQIFASACQDCHSNDTTWWWYSNIAPASWLIQDDVDGGRSNMNLSEWNKPQPELDEIKEVISKGEMPPLKYKIAPNHADARLSDKEKADLIAGFEQLYATNPPQTRQGEGG